MIEKEFHNDVTLLRMAHGKANALDVELLQAISAALADVENSGSRALVLTGTGSIFCAGVDLYRLLEGGRATFATSSRPSMTPSNGSSRSRSQPWRQ